MKITVEKEEWWPVYVPSTEYLDANEAWGDTVDAPDNIIERYKIAAAAFGMVQAELKALHAKQVKNRTR